MDYNKIKMIIINSMITKRKKNSFIKVYFLEKYMVWEDENLRIGASERGPMLEEQISEGIDSKFLGKI